MGARKFGPWNKAVIVAKTMKVKMDKASKLYITRMGSKAEGIAKKHMRNQDLGWESLKPSTIAQKARSGLSGNILIATSSYFQSITSFTEGSTAFVGVRRTVRNKDGEIIANIAKIHEFGGRNIPKRPLWKPTLDEMKGFIRSDKSFNIILKGSLSL